MAKGMPWLNVQRPQKSLGQKMKFVFKHALSQLNVQIDADVNTNEHGAGSDVDGNTKVFVRSVTFNGFAMKGALNLNNEEKGVPNWKGYGCSNEPLQSEEYTIYDGMKDGKEGTGYTASNEKVTGLNETIIQSKKWSEQAAADGVQKTAKNLFNSSTPPTDPTAALEAPIYVIPTGDDMTVTIVYDIETKDANLAGTVSDLETAGVSIENRITKTITVTGSDPSQALKLEAGKKYTIKLHLGMSQVEFDAEVSDWDDANAVNGEAWLPENGEAVPVPTLSTATPADVGKWVDAAGNILDSATGAAGWIAYATDDHHGLILAMENSATGKKWDEAQTVDFSGLPSIALTSGSWHLPSANGTDGEWDKMDAGIDANAASRPLESSRRYWSSTGYDTSNAWGYFFPPGTSGAVINYNKVIPSDVRAVLAF